MAVDAQHVFEDQFTFEFGDRRFRTISRAFLDGQRISAGSQLSCNYATYRHHPAIMGFAGNDRDAWLKGVAPDGPGFFRDGSQGDDVWTISRPRISRGDDRARGGIQVISVGRRIGLSYQSRLRRGHPLSPYALRENPVFDY